MPRARLQQQPILSYTWLGILSWSTCLFSAVDVTFLSTKRLGIRGAVRGEASDSKDAMAVAFSSLAAPNEPNGPDLVLLLLAILLVTASGRSAPTRA